MQQRRGVARGLALVAVTAVAGSLMATTAVSGEAATKASGQAQPGAAAEQGTVATSVDWGDCPAEVAEVNPLLQCGLVPVPLDYDDPDGVEIEIMVSRLASTDPEARRGVLMYNPGGPGGSGLTMPADSVAQGLPGTVSASYDLIGMDTRGVGYSAPISCGFTDEQDYRGATPRYAVDSDAVVEHAKTARGIAAQCAENDVDDRMRHITTANMARDLDRIRIALGEEKTSYLGYSYGTALGAAYTSMFPERSDRIVLDSNLGDTHADRDALRRYALGVEDTFPNFARWAAERHESYGLGKSPAQVRATYLELAGRLDEQPVDGLDGDLFRRATFGSLYNAIQYPALAQAWQSVNSGDAAAARALVTRSDAVGSLAAAPVASDASEGLAEFDNSWSVFLAVTCNDVEWPSDVATYQQAVEEDRQRYPLFGAASANIFPCAYWSHEPAEPPVAINDDGPRNILILQNRQDPVTPLKGAQVLRENFEQRSRLVTVDGSGHGAYVLGDNACALNTTTTYLVEGTMPTRDIPCRP